MGCIWDVLGFFLGYFFEDIQWGVHEIMGIEPTNMGIGGVKQCETVFIILLVLSRE